MTRHDYKQSAYYLIYLIRCVLNNKTPSKEKLDNIDLAQLYLVAKAHSLNAITAYALESVGIYDKIFEEEKNKAIRKNILLDFERERILSELENAGIWYMPLKGIILKDYYPQIGMRQMCDNDILFDKSLVDDVKRIMTGLDFEMKHDDSGHDLEFVKAPVCNFEMHTALFGAGYGASMNPYYDNVFSRLLKDDNNQFGYHFSNEDFYIFMQAHEYKHFYMGGTGLRSLLDVFVFLSKFNDCLNWDYINKELSDLGIYDYEQGSKNLSIKLFSGIKLSSAEKDQLDYYIFSGTYGTKENMIKNTLNKNGGGVYAKILYFIDRLFVPLRKSNPKYNAYKKQYPLFYKHPVILPFLPFFRLIHIAIKGRKRLSYELKSLIKL